MPHVVSCDCNVAAPSQFALAFVAAGTVRVPGQIDAGLLGYYPLGGGDDISGLGNHATPAIEPVGTVPGILCEPAELLDGRQFYELPFALPGSLTVSLWLRPAAVRLEQTVLSLGPYLRLGLSFLLEPIVSVNRGLASEVNITGPRLPAGEFLHMAYVIDDASGEARIYVDGAAIELRRDGQAGKRPAIPAVADRSPPVFSRYGIGSGLHGAAQDLVIRSAALTPAEIAAEHASYCETQFVVTS